MKILHSNQENVWFILVSVDITEAEKEILKNGTEEEKQLLSVSLKERSVKDATKEESDSAIILYNSNKPNEEFELIHASIDLDDNSGFINYRQEGQHKQIYF